MFEISSACQRLMRIYRLSERDVRSICVELDRESPVSIGHGVAFTVTEKALGAAVSWRSSTMPRTRGHRCSVSSFADVGSVCRADLRRLVHEGDSLLFRPSIPEEQHGHHHHVQSQ